MPAVGSAGRASVRKTDTPGSRCSRPAARVGYATVRHRTARTKGALSAKTAELMMFKLVNAAAKTWRRLKGENQLPKVVQGVKFQNGIEVIELPAHHAA
jgi:putative transposase